MIPYDEILIEKYIKQAQKEYPQYFSPEVLKAPVISSVSSRPTRTGGRCTVTHKKHKIEIYHIVISRFLIANCPEEVYKTVKHELVHAYLFSQGYFGSANSHYSPLFQQIAKEVGASIYLPTRCLPKQKYYVYTCPKGHIILTKRKLKRKSSCGYCSKKYNPSYILTYSGIAYLTGEQVEKITEQNKKIK